MGAGAVSADLFMAVGAPLRMAAFGIWHSFLVSQFSNDGGSDQPHRLIVRADVSPEILQFIPATLGLFALTAAIPLVSVLSASRTDPFAILIAHQLHWQGEKDDLAENFV